VGGWQACGSERDELPVDGLALRRGRVLDVWNLGEGLASAQVIALLDVSAR